MSRDCCAELLGYIYQPHCLPRLYNALLRGEQRNTEAAAYQPTHSENAMRCESLLNSLLKIKSRGLLFLF